jgi:hypothetical protein
VDPGRFRIERDRVEFVLRPLQDIQPTGSLGLLVVLGLLIVPAYLVRAGR